MYKLILVALGCTVAWGCSDSTSTGDRPPVFQVAGTIRYQGQPLADAVVTFFPISGKQSAFGRTDPAGHYTLTTFETDDGAEAGDYAVVIQKYEPQAPTGSPEGENYVPPTNIQQAPPKLLTPTTYLTPQTTPLKATVKAGEENQFDFELK
jgi:hypothetical protein